MLSPTFVSPLPSFCGSKSIVTNFTSGYFSWAWYKAPEKLNPGVTTTFAPLSTASSIVDNNPAWSVSFGA